MLVTIIASLSDSMPIHLIKLAVGISDPDHLAEVQQGRRFVRDGMAVVPAYTRRKPRRPDEVTGGGSIYWVIKGQVRCRQRVLDFEMMDGEEGETWCRIILDPTLVPTLPQSKKAFQGWRYLEPDAAPRDLGDADPGGELPPHILAELRELGLA
ncbi:DUF1489 family protein [Skermanella mucosa]|uniref:DUF1489 family protein n=1 Tax=Skermanella mucosa TaxID=1789672 RepID=UPI002B2055A5|nr:DUF1489 domain-containing protein [Skermanella mucosa]